MWSISSFGCLFLSSVRTGECVVAAFSLFVVGHFRNFIFRHEASTPPWECTEPILAIKKSKLPLEPPWKPGITVDGLDETVAEGIAYGNERDKKKGNRRLIGRRTSSYDSDIDLARICMWSGFSSIRL